MENTAVLEYSAKENREYKDSVFVDLFFEDETAADNELALFNALHGTHYTKDEMTIDRIRVDQTLYMNFRNDVSYKVGGKFLIFAEHQSTVNPNMCIRSLMYAGRAYEQLVPVRSRYSGRKVEIPLPEFYVFYNGTEDYPEEQIIKLSDSYQIRTDDPLLELKVKVININPEKNHEILEKCPVLNEYMKFVDAVRKFKKSGERESIRNAVEQCIRQDILREYLSRKASEVRQPNNLACYSGIAFRFPTS